MEKNIPLFGDRNGFNLLTVKKGLLRLGQNDRFSDDCSTFYSNLVGRPEKTAIGKACLTMLTGIGSILATGNG